MYLQKDAIHIDLRLMKKVSFYPPYSLKFQSGCNWGDVLKVVDPSRYTIIHGQVTC